MDILIKYLSILTHSDYVQWLVILHILSPILQMSSELNRAYCGLQNAWGVRANGI